MDWSNVVMKKGSLRVISAKVLAKSFKALPARPLTP